VFKGRSPLPVVLLIAAVCLSAYASLGAQGTKGTKAKASPKWVWLGPEALPNQSVYFRKEFTVDKPITAARLSGTCDNRMTVYINGKEALSGDNWETPVSREVTEILKSPVSSGDEVRNVICVKAHNDDGPAGLVLRLEIEMSKKKTVIVTDGTWRASDAAGADWTQPHFDDQKWAPATVVAGLGSAPWKTVTEASLAGGGKLKKPTATPVELIKVKKDYKVELLYSVPKQTQGSWVSLCTDPKGRLIASDQYGKLYRITPPPIGGNADATRVEELPVDLGEAQGLLWAFDSLYVVVNRGKKYESGLWRVWSSRNDDVLDAKEKLRGIDGNGEHGPHAVLLGPDGKSLYVLHGNHTKMVKVSSTKVPMIWGEDFLTPRLWDAGGHAVGILAPAGCIYKVSPDGKDWELISMGYRNQYDAAFNRDGELFTYDADMEWDINTPWYRPTRVCHAVPGSEFGWRGGTGKMYEYHPDNMPPVVNVGPGSPTGVVFGYGAKFPAKYQEALFLCDWSYGKLYACHLTPKGASYTGELEEFLNGSPLPLTDIVISPKDGAMYFTIGGRTTMSGLYRVTYVGKTSTEPAPPTAAFNPPRETRRTLERYYGKKDPQAIDVAWSNLASGDRFVRWAARTVLEFQDPATWQERALTETTPVALINALIGLARASKDKALEPRMLDALEPVDWSKLSREQRIDLLRAYQLTFVRLGAPTAEWKARVGKRLDALYPSGDREVNAELCKLVCYLETPGAVSKTMALLAKAPTQEEQIEYALSLRMVKSGWTKKEHEDYFNWFHRAAAYRGGNSFHGFLRNIRKDAVKSLSAAEAVELKDVLAVEPQPARPKFDTKPRPFVKKWELDELVPVVEKGLHGRSYDKGRELFGEAKCFACHRFNNEGGGLGPDLTQVSGRYGVRDLLEKVLNPSKAISDQYQAIVITTTDGRQIVGRVVNLFGDNIQISPDMLDPNKLISVNRAQIDTIEPSKVSMMPQGLLDTLTRDEILDLAAYLYSRGDRNSKYFRKE
jgi:putative heme-binding domain-containing protein